ncbi:hypothetical protein [Nonomuraea sp. NPDC003804]|uniref:hypothetical protein n=1 Tax=Nonomuraea sp. NPDC003804 TaxID=3154547 RepID=UPI0033A9953E
MKLTQAAYAVTGVLFLVYPAVRPSGDDAAAMSATAWVLGHLAAMIGFVLLGLAALGLHRILKDRLSFRAAVATWTGAGLTLPYYGAEDFGLHVIARRALRDNTPALMELAGEFRYDPLAATMFALGLALLGVGAIMTAVSVWRSGTLPAWSGVPLAAGFALFIPQFFAPLYALRIAHGALIAVGGLWLAIALAKGRSAAPVEAAVPA